MNVQKPFVSATNVPSLRSPLNHDRATKSLKEDLVCA